MHRTALRGGHPSMPLRLFASLLLCLGGPLQDQTAEQDTAEAVVSSDLWLRLVSRLRPSLSTAELQKMARGSYSCMKRTHTSQYHFSLSLTIHLQPPPSPPSF